MKKRAGKRSSGWLMIGCVSAVICLVAAVTVSGSRSAPPTASTEIAWDKDTWPAATCDLRNHLNGVRGTVSYFEKVDAQGRELLRACVERIPKITVETLHDPEFDEIMDEAIGPAKSCARNMVRPLREAKGYLELARASHASLLEVVNGGHPMDDDKRMEKRQLEETLLGLEGRVRGAGESLAALELGIKEAEKMMDDRIAELGGRPHGDDQGLHAE